MGEAVTISNEELAILCDIVSGWGAKSTITLQTNKRQALDRLIANGFCRAGSRLRYEIPTHSKD